MQQVLDSISKLDSIELPEYKSGEVISDFVDKCNRILNTCFQDKNLIFLHTSYKPSFKVYRVRPFSEIKNFELLNEFSHPPKKNTSIQRVNLPYNPVFYCSRHPYTALREYIKSNFKEQTKYCVSVWSFDKNIPKICLLPIFKKDMTDFILKEQVELIFQGKSDEFRLALTTYINYFGDKFLKQINNVEDYSFSAYLGHKFLYKKDYNNGDTVDILIYPCVSSLSEINFAIHPKIVSKHMILEYVYVIEFLNESIISENFDIYLFKNNKFDSQTLDISLKDSENEYVKMFVSDFNIELN